MKILDFLAPSSVTTDLVAADKPEILEQLARKAAPVTGIAAEQILSELLKREELGSTGMGGGVAIPHARFHDLKKPVGMLVRLKKPIDFEAVDGKPVDAVFLLLLPDQPAGEQLSALACTARKLRDPSVIAAVRRAPDSVEIFRTLTAD